MRRLSTDRTRRRHVRMSKSRNRAKEVKWSNAVRERDEHTCQRCGTTNDIHAHHIAPRSRRPDLKYDVANGIALCGNCHRWCHENPKESTNAGFLSDVPYENKGYYTERLREVKQYEQDFSFDVMEIF